MTDSERPRGQAAAGQLPRQAPPGVHPHKEDPVTAVTDDAQDAGAEAPATENFGGRIPSALAREVRVYAATNRRKLQDVLAQALREFLDTHRS